MVYLIYLHSISNWAGYYLWKPKFQWLNSMGRSKKDESGTCESGQLRNLLTTFVLSDDGKLEHHYLPQESALVADPSALVRPILKVYITCNNVRLSPSPRMTGSFSATRNICLINLYYEFWFLLSASLWCKALSGATDRIHCERRRRCKSGICSPCPISPNGCLHRWNVGRGFAATVAGSGAHFLNSKVNTNESLS